MTFCDVFELSKSDLFYELRRRDIDLVNMLELFAVVHYNNKRRNEAIQENLFATKQKDTKLSKIIDTSDNSYSKKRAVLDIFLPGSRFRFCWDMVCTGFIIYFAFFVLYRVAFGDEKKESVFFVGFDFTVDAFFAVDFYLRSTHFAFIENGSVATEKDSIRMKYKKNGMLVDFASCLSALELASYQFAWALGRNLRLLCLLRVFRVPSFFNQLCDHLSLRGIRISLASNLLSRIIFFYVITNHWNAFIWFIIHRYLERGKKFTWATSDCPWDDDVGSDGCLAKWDEARGEHNICNMDSMFQCYIRSLHFSLNTLSSVGYGEFPIMLQN